MIMTTTFRAFMYGDSRQRLVTEIGEGDFSLGCIEHARVKMLGCDYHNVGFVSSVEGEHLKPWTYAE